jgi:hypothetical protein
MTKPWGVFLLCFGAMILINACVSPPSSQVSQIPETAAGRGAARYLVRTEPAARPDWKDAPPKSAEELYFVGVSKFFSTAAEARNDAREDALVQVMRFYGEYVKSSAAEKTSITGSSAETLAALISREEEIATFAQAVVSQIGTDRYYTEVYLDGLNREEYLVYALCQIPRQKAEQDIADLAKNTSQRYGRLLVRPPTLHAALLMYGEILAALEQNPLHRAVAYYDSPDGRVNLYEYLSLQLNTLTGSVAFAPLPPAVIEKTGALDTTVRVLSSLIDPVGALDCGVSIYGLNNPSPTVKYTVRADNAFSLQIFTSRLDPGRYTVRLELLLNEINPRIQKNPTESFSLEIQPLSAGVEFFISGGGISEAEKNNLIYGIQQGIHNHGVPVQLKPGRAEPGGAVFTLTLTFREQAPAPPANTALLICKAAISFSLNGQMLATRAAELVEFDIPGAIDRTQEFITKNETFFGELTQRLSP